jgi:Domain of unknown function (DUF4173)
LPVKQRGQLRKGDAVNSPGGGTEDGRGGRLGATTNTLRVRPRCGGGTPGRITRDGAAAAPSLFNEAKKSGSPAVEGWMGFSTRLALGTVAAGAALGIWADVLFHGRPLGLNVLLWALAFTGALALLLRLGRAPWRQGQRWMLAPLLLFSAAFVWRDSTLLTAVNLLALAGAVTIGALRRTTSAERPAVADYAAGAVAAGSAAAAGAVVLLHEDIEWDEATRELRSERPRAVVRGLGLGLPLLAVFGGLFIAADAVFKSYVTAVLPSFDRPVEHIGLVLGAAWLSAGVLRDLLAAREEQRLVSPASIRRKRIAFSIGTTEVAIALGALNVLFLSFVLVQFRYLFGGQRLVEARAHLTYAEYARHGFFELVVVAVLVLLVLLAADGLLRGSAGGGALLVRCLSAGLLALVFVVMVSALQRMRLYEHVYGLTQLRVYAVGIIAWLGVVFAWFGVTVLRERRGSFALGAVIAGFAATVVLNVVNPDALIARTNLDRSRVDIPYVAGLGDDAVPTMLEKLRSLRPDLRRALAGGLLRRSRDAGDWRSFNLARSRADELLAEQHDELVLFSR